MDDSGFRSQTWCIEGRKFADSFFWKWVDWHAERLEWRVAVLSWVPTHDTSGKVHFFIICSSCWIDACEINSISFSFTIDISFRLIVWWYYFRCDTYPLNCRILRDRALYKVTSDFVDAATSGAIGVISRCIPPINPTDPECFHMWVVTEILNHWICFHSEYSFAISCLKSVFLHVLFSPLRIHLLEIASILAPVYLDCTFAFYFIYMSF